MSSEAGSGGRTYCMPREAASLTFNTDFRRAYKRGKCVKFPEVVVYINRNRTGEVRYGITSSKKIGNAVTRNRARRVIRAAFFSSDIPVKRGFDLVFVARSMTALCKSTELVLRLKKALAPYTAEAEE